MIQSLAVAGRLLYKPSCLTITENEGYRSVKFFWKKVAFFSRSKSCFSPGVRGSALSENRRRNPSQNMEATETCFNNRTYFCFSSNGLINVLWGSWANTMKLTQVPIQLFYWGLHRRIVDCWSDFLGLNLSEEGTVGRSFFADTRSLRVRIRFSSQWRAWLPSSKSPICCW